MMASNTEKNKSQKSLASEHSSLSLCTNPASGRGLYWDGPLCTEHLKKDEYLFKERLSNIKKVTDEPLAKVSGLVKQTSGLKFELLSDRDEAFEMFEPISERIQQCRQKMVEKLDYRIAGVEHNLKVLSFVTKLEKLSADINDAEAKGDQIKSFQLRKEVLMSIEEVQFKDLKWLDSAELTLNHLEGLRSAFETFAGEAECSDREQFRRRLARSLDFTSSVEFNGKVIFVCICVKTAGFFYSPNAMSTTLKDGFQALPKVCVLSVRTDMQQSPQSWNFVILNMDLEIISQWLTEGNGTPLVSGTLVDHLQQVFLLTQNSLIITDLTGTQLRTVPGLPFGSQPIFTHDMEKLYLVISSYRVSCFSLQSFEMQESMQLPSILGGSCSVTVSGRSLIFSAPTGVYRMSLITRHVIKLLPYESYYAKIVPVITIGCGLLLACPRGQPTILTDDGQNIRLLNLSNNQPPIPLTGTYIGSSCSVVFLCKSPDKINSNLTCISF